MDENTRVIVASNLTMAFYEARGNDSKTVSLSPGKGISTQDVFGTYLDFVMKLRNFVDESDAGTAKPENEGNFTQTPFPR